LFLEPRERCITDCPSSLRASASVPLPPRTLAPCTPPSELAQHIRTAMKAHALESNFIVLVMLFLSSVPSKSKCERFQISGVQWRKRGNTGRDFILGQIRARILFIHERRMLLRSATLRFDFCLLSHWIVTYAFSKVRALSELRTCSSAMLHPRYGYQIRSILFWREQL
jgi:hypothetical protein